MAYQAATESCSFFLSRLQNEIDRLRSVPFPGHHTGPRKWLKLIEGLVDTGRACLAASAKAGITPTDVADVVIKAERFGNVAYKLLQHVAGADASQIPHQVVAPFQRVVERLGINNTIFFRSEHVANYELWTYDRGVRFATDPHATALLKNAISEIDWPVLRVTVPGHAMGMLPHFAVVGHELGHAIQSRFQPDITSLGAQYKAFLANLQTRLQTQKFPVGSSVVYMANEIIRNWGNELKADAVGYLLGGPSFFFAYCGFLQLAEKSYGLGPSHPPTDLRRRLLLSQLNGGAPSFCEVFETKTGLKITEAINSPGIPICPDADHLFATNLQRDGILHSAICAELVPLAEALGPLIYSAAHDYMKANCPELIYSTDDLGADLDDHLEPLCNLVPPIESVRGGKVLATTLASILNVGWAALLTRLNRIPEASGSHGDSASRKMERLHELLLKGAELSEAKRLWEEQV